MNREPLGIVSPWLTAQEAASFARVGVKLIYREAKKHRLRAAIVGGRRSLRFREEWISEWLESMTTLQEIAH